MTDETKSHEQDLQSARALAAAALPGMVSRLAEMGLVCEDPEVVRKAADTLAKIAEPRRDEQRANLPVFNITFQGSGHITAEPVQMVEEVQSKPLELPAVELVTDEPPSEDVLAFLQGLGVGDAEL